MATNSVISCTSLPPLHNLLIMTANMDGGLIAMIIHLAASLACNNFVISYYIVDATPYCFSVNLDLFLFRIFNSVLFSSVISL